MYPWIPCELVADPVGSGGHTLGTTDIEDWELSDSEEDNTEQADSFPNMGIGPCTLIEGLNIRQDIGRR
jgi:hypothetical protein